MKRNLTLSILLAANLACPIFAQNPAPQSGQQQPSTASTTAQPPKKTQSQILTDLGVFVYPKNKQSKSQQDKDTSECLAWTKEQTGIDPAAPIQAQPAAAPAEQQKGKTPKGGAVKGAAKGAAGGAAIGAIAGDAGTGAAVGATTGAVVGRRKQKKAEKASKQQAEAQAQAAQKEQTAQTKDALRKAFSACMDARGYSIK
jgi:hypothetical protein